MTEHRTIENNLKAYAEECTTKIKKTDFSVLASVAELLIETKKTGATVFTAGNGGSASTASHMCNDLTKGCRVWNRTGFITECLDDSLPLLTCLSNDFCYEDVFKIALQTKAKKGDVFIAFSGSGNSENIIRAYRTAREMGLVTVGFSGRNGGKMASENLCDYLILAPSESMEQIEDMHMLYEHALACIIRNNLEKEFGIEILNYKRNSKIKTALFDFDGTISLIREGWQQIMIPYFIEELSTTNSGESTEEISRIVHDFVETLTGKQTIFQCIRLDEEIVKRGGIHKDPLIYKKNYLDRLHKRIKNRLEGLKNGTLNPEDYRVPGSLEFVRLLRKNGIKCYLASGTDENNVLEEARLLGLEGEFDGGIHGARDDMIECSKELVIKDIFNNHSINPNELISFGDGYVEIELVVNLGGYAIGVATDEENKCGINEWKRNRLIAAGAGAIIPDFASPQDIIDFIRAGY